MPEPSSKTARVDDKGPQALPYSTRATADLSPGRLRSTLSAKSDDPEGTAPVCSSHAGRQGPPTSKDLTHLVRAEGLSIPERRR